MKLHSGARYNAADVFFRHRITNDLNLEDGAVNCAFATVELGGGVRVVKGDQTGYGYTEDLSASAMVFPGMSS